MIPRFFKTGDFVEPPAPLYYLVASSGAFLVKKTELFTSITDTPLIAGLMEQKPSLALHFGKIPSGVMERIYGFFDWAWREWESEAIVFLYYAPATGTFEVEAPPQTLFRYRSLGRWRTEGRVAYETAPRPNGYVKLGDAHSHGGLPPFFSAADDRDDCEEGLKIVMGNMDQQHPDIEVSFVAGGSRFALEAAEAVEDFRVPLPPPKEWIRRVSCRYETESYGLQR